MASTEHDSVLSERDSGKGANDRDTQPAPRRSTEMFEVDQLVPTSEKSEWLPCLRVMSGAQAGKLFELGEYAVIGREVECHVHLSDKGVSRRHARIFLDNGALVIMDVGSRNGTWCNGERLTNQHRLEDGDRIQVGAALLKFSFVDAMERDFQRRQYESVTRDALTGCHNRKAFDERLPAEMAFAYRHDRPVSLVMLDIDHFKRVNDTYGHLGGDAVLRMVGAILRASIRTEDVVCRYGGEEFAVILREQGADSAWVVAERLRRAIEAASCTTANQEIHVTASLGVATWVGGDPDGKGLVKVADQALYAAKLAGRNRVVPVTVPQQ